MRARLVGALGPRGRIIGAVLAASVATLIVAAVALLGPLEHSLRNAEKATLEQELQGNRGTGSFTVRGDDPGKVAYSFIPLPPPKTHSQGTGGASISPGSSKKSTQQQAALTRQYREGVRVEHALTH